MRHITERRVRRSGCARGMMWQMRGKSQRLLSCTRALHSPAAPVISSVCNAQAARACLGESTRSRRELKW
jgi:hypothetical protein